MRWYNLVRLWFIIEFLVEYYWLPFYCLIWLQAAHTIGIFLVQVNKSLLLPNFYQWFIKMYLNTYCVSLECYLCNMHFLYILSVSCLEELVTQGFLGVIWDVTKWLMTFHQNGGRFFVFYVISFSCILTIDFSLCFVCVLSGRAGDTRIPWCDPGCD